MSVYIDTQDPKYQIEIIDNGASARLVHAVTKEPLPKDMPAMIFLAKDRKAPTAIEQYLDDCDDPAHREAVECNLNEFYRFQKRNPSRVKEPDTSIADLLGTQLKNRSIAGLHSSPENQLQIIKLDENTELLEAPRKAGWFLRHITQDGKELTTQVYQDDEALLHYWEAGTVKWEG